MAPPVIVPVLITTAPFAPSEATLTPVVVPTIVPALLICGPAKFGPMSTPFTPRMEPAAALVTVSAVPAAVVVARTPSPKSDVTDPLLVTDIGPAVAPDVATSMPLAFAPVVRSVAALETLTAPAAPWALVLLARIAWLDAAVVLMAPPALLVTVTPPALVEPVDVVDAKIPWLAVVAPPPEVEIAPPLVTLTAPVLPALAPMESKIRVEP